MNSAYAAVSPEINAEGDAFKGVYHYGWGPDMF
jgi:hypothetical protein